MAETTVKFNMTGPQLTVITDYLKYQTEIDEAPNPQSRKAFLHEYLQGHLKEIHKAGKVNAAKSSLQTARDESDTETATLTVKE